jgi:spore maturation protein CgeB
MMMLLTDRRMFQELRASHPSKVFHAPWANFFHKQPIEQPSKDEKRVVFIGNLVKYVSLPSLDDLTLDETSRRFLKELAQALIQDSGLDVQPAISHALNQVDEATRRNHHLRSQIEYIVRREVNRVYRKQVVITIAEAGIPLHVYGDTLWEKIFPGSGIYKGPLRGEGELNRALSTATIHLSLDAITMSDGVKMGTLDSACKGVFTIANYTPFIEEIFGGSLPTFRRIHELPDMIRYYLERDNERQTLAKTAQTIVQANHTAKIRASEMKAILEEISRNQELAESQCMSMK